MEFQLPAYFDYLATFIWALSGALLAARRGFAILGICTVACVSSTGGGLIRDGIFLQNGPPVLVKTPIYLQLIVLAVVVVIFLGARIARMPRASSVVAVVDALGLGAYAAVGMCHALKGGLTLLGVVMVGMVNAVGGGILRDVLLRDEVGMFKPGTLEELVALLGCFEFLILLKAVGLEEEGAAWITIGTVFTLRMLAIRYDIRSRPLPGYGPAPEERA